MDIKNRRFLWGMLLTGATFVLFLPLFLATFRGVWQEKATGLGAVAGGVAEYFVSLGMVAGFLIPLAAIVFLIKSFSQGGLTRQLLSVAAIGWSLLMIVEASFGIWMLFFSSGRLIPAT